MEIIEIDVAELKEKLNSDKPPFLLDVREEHEFDLVNLDGVLIPLGQLPGRIDELDDYKDNEIIVHCRSGARSAKACTILMEHGFKDVKNLRGGIIDWAKKIDPSFPIY